jgi:hypothetical protein
MYSGFYYTVFCYDNSLTLYWRNNEYFTLVFYICLHAAAIYYFLTTGNNPGFVKPDVVSFADDNENLKTGDVSTDEKDIELGALNKTEEDEEESKEDSALASGAELRKNKVN